MIYKFIDLFAGIGGFRTAFMDTGLECVFSSEINNSCKEVYNNNYKEIPYGDITKIDVLKIPSHDILTAGFPCQPFSVSGKRQGFRDVRGNLFFTIKEIARIVKPRIVFLENVKYLLYHDNGNTIKIIQENLIKLGYHVCYKLLNANDFGVPQNRERVIIIATKNKPFDFCNVKYIKKRPILKDFLEKDGEFEYLDKKEYTLINNPKQQTSGLIFVGYKNAKLWKTGIRKNTAHLSRVHRQPNRIYSDLGVHPTIPSQETSGRFFVYITNDKKVRKLTLDECYKIMGFTKKFIKHESKAESYKQIGNSVCVPMIGRIIDAIIKNNL